MTSKDQDDAVGEQLLHAVKVEVKRLMEEAVTKKFIHDGSSTVTSFCAAVEACLQHGLKKRSAFFGGSSAQGTFALLERISRSCEPAARILKMTREAENALTVASAHERRNSGNGSSEGSVRSGDFGTSTLPRIFNWHAFTPLSRTTSDAADANLTLNTNVNANANSNSNAGNNSRSVLSRQSSTPPQPHTPPAAPPQRYVWIRLALTDHVLHLIVQHIASNASKYYERHAVMADACSSALLASLIDGPCTLDFTKVKTCDHYMTDPPAEELIQRHRIHSNSLFHSGSLAAQSRFGTPTGHASQRPSLHVRKKPRRASGADGMTADWQPAFGVSTGVNLSGAAVSGAAKDYIEALHQNSRTTLLYGKNNVRVQLKMLERPLSGYLQLHQTSEPDCSLLLKWTPNQLMNAGVSENGDATPTPSTDADADPEADAERNFAQRSCGFCTSPLSSCACESKTNGSAAASVSSRGVKLSVSLQVPTVTVTDADPVSLDESMRTRKNAERMRKNADAIDGRMLMMRARKGSEAGQYNEGHRLRVSDRVERYRDLSPSRYRNQFRIMHERWQPRSLIYAIAKHGRRRLFWKYALTIQFDDVVYIHCHCHRPPEEYDTVILVGRDGTQYPPFDFPKGGHLFQFLTCIENGIQLAGGYIDPPLSSDQLQLDADGVSRLRRRSSLLQLQRDTISLAEALNAPEVLDFVFRIIHPHVAYRYADDDEFSQLLAEAREEMNGESSSVRTSHTSLATAAGGTAASAGASSSTGAGAIAAAVTATDSSPASPSPSVSTSISSTTAGGATPALPSAASVGPAESLAPHDAIRQLCETMRTQLLSRAFYGWLDYTRHIKTVRTHLSDLVNAEIVPNDSPCDARKGLTTEVWRRVLPASSGVLQVPLDELRRLVYYGGCAGEVRRHVWPYLLGHYSAESNLEQRDAIDRQARMSYERTVGEWLAVEAIVQQREKERLEAFLSRKSGTNVDANANAETASLENGMFDRHQGAGGSSYASPLHQRSSLSSSPTGSFTSLNNPEFDRHERYKENDTANSSANANADDSLATADIDSVKATETETEAEAAMATETATATEAERAASVIVQVCGSESETAADASAAVAKHDESTREKDLLNVHVEVERVSDSPGIISNSKESLVSPGSPAANGDIYRRSLIEEFGLNLHRIEKDVQRCDRNHPYFASAQNLDKLRNIVCTYVWTHLEMGYAQGMCDLVAPLLVILDDEALTYSCYLKLMDRVVDHFPRDGVPHAVLDSRFASMRSLVQILDAELFELMQRNGDYTHFFFAYRWFLLEFKRELAYNDVFAVWESIWCAPAISTSHFVLFVALALVQFYREIIIDNNMDFTDIIRFFNEMAEKHDGRQLLCVARYLVYQLQTLVQNR